MASPPDRVTLVLSILQFARWFAWAMGVLAGAATMLANAAGPVFAVYLIAVGLPKMEFVGTSAWFFFIINLFKVPFSIALGLIHGQTLMVNLILAPAVLVGVLAGRWLLERIPQRLFEHMLLAFAVLAALYWGRTLVVPVLIGVLHSVGVRNVHVLRGGLSGWVNTSRV